MKGRERQRDEDKGQRDEGKGRERQRDERKGRTEG